MKQAKRSLFAIMVLILLFTMQQLGVTDALISGMEHVAWWVYLVIAGILFSGYQAFTLSKKEEQEDTEWLEQQGNVYMRRMKAEKERRLQEKNPKATH